MRNVTKFLAVTGLLAMSIALAGCQDVGAPAAPKKAPEAVLQEGLIKLSALTSYTYNVNLTGDLKGPVNEPPEKVTFDVKATGGIDTKDSLDPKLNLTLKGSMMADQDGADASLAFRMNKEALFLNLDNVTGKGAIAIPEEMKAQFVGKWWTLPIPPEALTEMSKSMPQGDAATMTEDQKKMKSLIEETKFFKNVAFVDNQSVSGETAYHYTGALDKDAFATFIVKASELQGQTISEEEKTSMKASLEGFDFTGDFYVGQTSGTLIKVKGQLTIKENAEKSSPSGTVTLEGSVADLNKPVTVEVPADAQPFPTEALGALPL